MSRRRRKSQPKQSLGKTLAGQLTRRQLAQIGAAFLMTSACRHIGAGHANVLADIPAGSTPGAGKKVVVLGGGVSGLCAAYNLKKIGYTVTVLELTNRIGGRIFTEDQYFAPYFCEYGATRIASSHDRTLAYIDEFGLEKAVFDGEENTVFFVDGVVRHKIEKMSPNEADWPPDMTLSKMESLYTQASFSKLGDPRANQWPNGLDQNFLRDMDKETFMEYLRRVTGSELGAKLVKFSNGSEVDMFSALAWMGAEALDKEWSETFRVKKGNHRLPEAFAERLNGSIELLAKVQRVETIESGVRVAYQQRGEQRSIDADYVVCTLPLPVLKEIDWQPGLSAEKLAASQEIPMQFVTRVNLMFKERFWNREKLLGLKVLHSDLEIERLWNMTATQVLQPELGDQEPGILTCYIQFKNAQKVGAMEPAERIEFVLNEMSKIWPNCRDLLVRDAKGKPRATSWVWHQQKWVGGGWAAFPVNKIDLYFALAKAEGRVSFAGDHTTLYSGWIQGALLSAERAVSEILGQTQGGQNFGAPTDGADKKAS